MKNSNGEGSIYPVRRAGKPAGYAGAVTYTDDDGNRKRYTAYGKTQRDVRQKLDAVRGRIEAGGPPRDAADTVGAWLQHWRGTVLAAAPVKPATRDAYARQSRLHLEPAPFGAVRLDKLRPSNVDALLVALRAKTKTPKATPGNPNPAPRPALSEATIKLIYATLRAGLDAAVRDGLLARNPAVKVAQPHVSRQEAMHLSGEQVRALLIEAKASRYYPVLALIAATALRRGEALGLRWDAVDLDGGTVKVVATLGEPGGKLTFSEPKSKRSRRTVPIPASVVAMLRSHKKDQAVERLKAGNQWSDENLVFPTEFGTPTRGNPVLRAVKVAAKAAGIDNADDVGPHTLRHSAAVAWIEAGVHIRAVADLLGHSSIAITGDVYLHSSDAVTRGAVDALGAVLDL